MEDSDTHANADKLVLVSNRLPVTIARRKSQLSYQASVGGLATAMSAMAGQEYQWIGWPGTHVRKAEKLEVQRRLEEDYHCAPVYLTSTQIKEFYSRFCNGVLWPLFHYLPEYTDFDLQGWNHYRKVNEQFADVVASQAPPDAFIWVHDYHLMLLPQLLRDRLPNAKIGFFLHIPFPSSEVFRLLPVRRQILQGLLGADVIGFHTYYYVQHFNNSCRRILGCDTEPHHVNAQGRRVRLCVDPIGIDLGRFRDLVDAPETQRELKKLSKRYAGHKLILGVDRLDYSKGITYKLEAFRRFLERFPDLASRCVFLQIAAPSRTGVSQYRELRREIEELVGHINGLYSTVHRVPIHFLFQNVSPAILSALYQLAEVCWVTPIRDGMNLVCQEYLASQRNANAVLILSEFAGAAHQLEGAVQVNPWHADQMADALHQSLEMPLEERQTRLDQMQAAVQANTSFDWARKFVDTLKRHTRARDGTAKQELADDQLEALHAEWERASERFVLLDHAVIASHVDGALAETTVAEEFTDILPRIANQATVYVISDAPKSSQLEETLGALQVHLCVDRGYLLKPCGEHTWRELVEFPADWMRDVLPVMKVMAATTPGAVVDTRDTALTWNWQGCEPGFGRWQANELAAYLNESLANLPLEVVHKHRSVEVRPQGVNQGALSRYVAARRSGKACVVAVGDESTDEAFFAELPNSAWTCRVGPQTKSARFVLGCCSDVAALLDGLATAKRERGKELQGS